jgi:hypothetical protein
VLSNLRSVTVDGRPHQVDPVARLLDAAPLDDEPEDETERVDVSEALTDSAGSISHEEIKREFDMA